LGDALAALSVDRWLGRWSLCRVDRPEMTKAGFFRPAFFF
jgi:hypothetical protein